MCLNQVRIWSLSPHRSFLEKVQGVLLITGITVKVPGMGHAWIFSSGEAAHCFLHTLVKGDTSQGIDPVVWSMCLAGK